MKGLSFVLVLTAFAGCLGADDGPSNSGEQDPVPSPPQLDDAMAAWQAGDTSANLHSVGQWGQGGGEEADAWQDYVFVDRGSQIHTLRMDIQGYNVSLQEVSSFAATGPKDVKISDDGNWLFLGNDDQLSDLPVAGAVVDDLRAGGIYVYDVSNKENPVLANYEPVGPRRGPHMVFFHQNPDGSQLVLGANADISIHTFDGLTGALSEVSRYAPNYVTDVNRDPNVIDAYYQTYAHDMFVMNDPRDGTMLYVANWDAGLRMVDINDPANPVEVGGWNDFPEGHVGNLHTVVTDWVGDRRITIGTVEVGFAVVGGVQYVMGNEPSAMYVWDTTDASNIQLLSTWFNPDNAPAGRDFGPGESLTSTHNLQFEEGRVYLAHYGLGVFVVDVSTPELQANPQMVGFHRAPGMNTWDVLIHNGVMLSSGALGVQAFHFPLDELGPNGPRGRA